ncbi:nucleotidyltransferase domain-containing protein [Geobacter sp.]|uniref:nucleotidyltransferase domain-containing protein n=1 Tax=Geobacter sp. TaxID=46610 RepID=UPI00260D3D2D|nr:nucleotidyltransferase domain-containing protein [Geobacter sp.]
MAAPADTVIEIVRRYVEELKRHNIDVQQVILFGSYAKGNVKEESDIDIALVSDVFTGDRFEDRRKVVPFRRRIDSRIEPMPFRPERFAEGGNLVDEIKRTGIKIAV